MSLTHLDAQGRAAMVDVGHKPTTARVAVASGRLRMARATLTAITEGRLPKGDVAAVVRVAGIQAAKRTASLVPLCHPLPLTHVAVEVEPEEAPPALRVTATVRTTAKTGVEMEALTAASVGLLTAYDMAKGVDRTMTIDDLAVREKRGGASGDWQRDEGGPRAQDSEAPAATADDRTTDDTTADDRTAKEDA